MGLIHVNSGNFEQEILKSDIPVMVDFWAEWCAPCIMIGPVVEEVSNEFDGKLKVAKLNVDEAQDIAMRYGVMSIPTLIFFKGGQPVDQLVGAVGKDQLTAKISQNIG